MKAALSFIITLCMTIPPVLFAQTTQVAHACPMCKVANETDAQKHAWAQLQAHRVEQERWDPDLDGLGADTGLRAVGNGVGVCTGR